MENEEKKVELKDEELEVVNGGGIPEKMINKTPGVEIISIIGQPGEVFKKERR